MLNLNGQWPFLDDGGRYAFINQPEICKWNLNKLAEAISDVLPMTQSDPVLEKYIMYSRSHNQIGLFLNSSDLKLIYC